MRATSTILRAATAADFLTWTTHYRRTAVRGHETANPDDLSQPNLSHRFISRIVPQDADPTVESPALDWLLAAGLSLQGRNLSGQQTGDRMTVWRELAQQHAEHPDQSHLRSNLIPVFTSIQEGEEPPTTGAQNTLATDDRALIYAIAATALDADVAPLAEITHRTEAIWCADAARGLLQAAVDGKDLTSVALKITRNLPKHSVAAEAITLAIWKATDCSNVFEFIAAANDSTLEKVFGYPYNAATTLAAITGIILTVENPANYLNAAMYIPQPADSLPALAAALHAATGEYAEVTDALTDYGEIRSAGIDLGPLEGTSLHKTFSPLALT